MELRTYNVEDIWFTHVIIEMDEELGVQKSFWSQIENLKDMLSQIQSENGSFILSRGHIRKDGEQWTPYLQIIKMLVLMGKKSGLVSYEGKLLSDTKINLLWQE